MKILYSILILIIISFNVNSGTANEKDKFNFTENDIIYPHLQKTIKMERTSEITPPAYYLGKSMVDQTTSEILIYFSLPEKQQVRISILNILGEEIKVLANIDIASGTYKLTFDTGFLNTGMYVYRMQTEDFSASGKMLIIK